MCDLTSSIAIKRNKIKKKLFEILRSLKYKNYDNWMIEKILEKI
jgi:glucosamine 6-phosphate synthetase-like amidotransferase/phosphosugar isomerase protein